VSQFDVYGIGNALVDMEFEVLPDFLKKMDIEKGVMTLVDEERQDTLTKQLHGIQHKRGPGGSAANTIMAVNYFGGKAYYSCKVANDEMGDFYSVNLSDSGVSNNLSKERENGKTGKCMVFVTPDADRTMNTYLGITEKFSETELSVDDLSKSKYLYIEGYLVTSPTGRAAAVKAREHAVKNNIKTCITFSDPAMTTFFRDGLKEMMGEDKLHIIFCNESEAKSFSEKETTLDAANELLKYAEVVAITEGSRGAYITNGKREISVVAPKVEAVDTNGAGDAFAGAFLYAISNGFDLTSAGRFACSTASKLVTNFGARMEPCDYQSIKKDILEQ
jgi:sugar/nucleoside kinase (ribokinase family)